MFEHHRRAACVVGLVVRAAWASGVVAFVLFVLGGAWASPALALPDLSVVLGGSDPLHLSVTMLTAKTKFSNPVETLKGEGLLLLLSSGELSASGTFDLLFTKVKNEKSEACQSTGDASGEVLTSGSFDIVYTSLSPLRLGLLYLLTTVEAKCGSAKVTIEGDAISSLSAGEEEKTSVGGVLKGNGEGKPSIKTFYNNGGTAVTAKLTVNFGTGKKEAAVEIEEEVKVEAQSGKMFEITGEEAALPEFSSFARCREMRGYAGFPEKVWRWTEGPAPCKAQSLGSTGGFAESAFVTGKEGAAEAVFTAAGGFSVKCTGDAGAGELAPAIVNEPKEVKLFRWLFTNCVESLGGKCTTSGGTAGVISPGSLWGAIGYIPGTREVGADVSPEARTAVEVNRNEFNAIFVEFSCPATSVKIRGGLNGQVTPLNSGIAGVTGHFTLTYTQTAGSQTITRLEGVEGGVQNQLEISLNGAAYEKLGVSLKEELIPVENEEIRA